MVEAIANLAIITAIDCAFVAAPTATNSNLTAKVAVVHTKIVVAL